MHLLSKFESDDPIFIDASVWLRHYEGKSESASDFIERIERGKIKAYVSIAVCEEVAYISAKLEASLLLKTDRHYEILKGLKEKKIFSASWIKAETHLNFIEELERKNNLVLIREMPDLELFNRYARLFQLLPRDAIHAATCETYGINNIASSDKDFDRVKPLTRWIPE